MTRAEMEAVWGADGLTRLRPEALRGLRIPAGAGRVLVDIGLPKQGVFAEYELDVDRLPRISPDLPYLRLGGLEEGPQICVDEDSGRVVDFRADEGLRSVVNRDVETLAEFLYRYGRAANGEPSADVVRALREELSRLDPEALSDPESLWSFTLEEAEDGA